LKAGVGVRFHACNFCFERAGGGFFGRLPRFLGGNLAQPLDFLLGLLV
jgi:hypothetical protein